MNALRTKPEAPPARRPTPSSQDPAAGAGVGGLRVVTREIGVEEAGQRLDNLLIRLCKGVPKTHVYQLIRSGQVRVNGKRADAKDRVQVGDRLRIPPVRVAQSNEIPAPAVEFPILFEDESLIVLDKPAGVAVHGGSGVSSGVIEQLRSARPHARFLELVHRLDRDTSGVLLIASKRAALLEMHRQLRERESDKRYRCIVKGRWPLRSKTLAFPLQRTLSGQGERRVNVQAGGQEAITRVRGLAHAPGPGGVTFSLVEAKIETGRTHQIRVHLAHAGFPIVGDQKYGDFELNKLLHKIGHKRMFLHAFEIGVRHPIDFREMVLQAPVPQAFDKLMQAGAQAERAAP